MNKQNLNWDWHKLHPELSHTSDDGISIPPSTEALPGLVGVAVSPWTKKCISVPYILRKQQFKMIGQINDSILNKWEGKSQEVSSLLK